MVALIPAIKLVSSCLFMYVFLPIVVILTLGVFGIGVAAFLGGNHGSR